MDGVTRSQRPLSLRQRPQVQTLLPSRAGRRRRPADTLARCRGRARTRAFGYAAEAFGAEYVGEAWGEFFLWHDVPDVIADSKEFGTTFDPFFVFSFVPDAAEDDLPEGWPTEPLALHFLHHEGES